jgi:outer membrane lipoprotein SlyB
MKQLLISTMIASTLLLGACATHNNVRPVYVEDWERVQYGFIEDIAHEQAYNGANGHQLRGGRGNAVTVAAGFAGGAVIGGDGVKSQGTSNRIEVRIRLDSGASMTFAQEIPHDFRSGDRVRIEGGRIFRV